jgi:hypothetical protein
MKKLLLALVVATPAHAFECPWRADHRCPWIAMHVYGPIPDCTCMPLLVPPYSPPPVNQDNSDNQNPSGPKVIVNPHAQRK